MRPRQYASDNLLTFALFPPHDADPTDYFSSAIMPLDQTHFAINLTCLRQGPRHL